MTKEDLLNLYTSSSLIQNLSHNSEEIKNINGLSGSQLAFISSSLFLNKKVDFFYIFQKKESALLFKNDFENLSNEKTLFFSNNNKISNKEISQNTKSIHLINDETRNILISYKEAINKKIPNYLNFQNKVLQLKVDDQINTNIITEKLYENDFENVEFVTKPGEFSIRGYIIDVFSFSDEKPCRIVLSNDTIEMITFFDPETQLSINKIEKITIAPDIENINLMKSNSYIFSHLKKNTIIWIEDKNKTVSDFEKNIQLEIKNFNSINFTESRKNKLKNQIIFKSSEQPSFNKDIYLLEENILKNKSLGIQTIITTNSDLQKKRFNNIFNKLKIKEDFHCCNINLSKGFIDFDLNIAIYTDHEIFKRFYKKNNTSYFKKTDTLTLKQLTQLKRGDFVTHYDHGVGIFDGLHTIEKNNSKQDVLKIKYKNEGVLYVSVHSIQKVSKYKSKNDEKNPKINQLGKPTWKLLKQKVKKRIKTLAFDLVKLYAVRKSTEGFSFSKDSYLQNELESSFLFEDTKDQAEATKLIKLDMEKTYPMDRLICGDVGFGKTEIAIRAAFKAVADNKQVAILVPTTVLALQHFKTISERLKNFPCNIDYLNRFKTKKEITKSLNNLKSGDTDIIIGTHRLVSEDVYFKNLGLFIIDEEQKFGVGTKEKIRSLKETIDTLTLSATPIPRTLQLSLMGARDFSILATPPKNRNPIETEIINFDIKKICNKIQHEINRGGQVFFIHNRIENIEEIEFIIKQLLPDLKIKIGHGKMKGNRLEKVILDFINGEFDVLLSTTIVGNGVDIPNANTIIINNAHQFGLSDLHQIRGRVGRSNQQSFCYLISPPLDQLSKDAFDRLTAVDKFSNLGDGFNIAMKDLEIRGAGDVLGAEQSGFINDVGFHTYQRILEDAVEELKIENQNTFDKESNLSKKTECKIDTDLELIIPSTYVENVNERLYIYSEISKLNSLEKLNKKIDELVDRFGETPIQFNNLIKSIKLKWKAESIGISKMIIKNKSLIIIMPERKDKNYYESCSFKKILDAINTNPKLYMIKEKNDRLYIYINKKIESVNEADEILSTFE